jgi:hypothetical protein
MLAVTTLAAAQPPTGHAGAGAECSQTSTGLVPLTDLGKRKYRGHLGGLYPGGSNQPSRPYLRHGLAAAKRVRPVNGRIVLLSIGMSNASNEFRSFIRLATADPQLPAVARQRRDGRWTHAGSLPTRGTGRLDRRLAAGLAARSPGRLAEGGDLR